MCGAIVGWLATAYLGESLLAARPGPSRSIDRPAAVIRKVALARLAFIVASRFARRPVVPGD
jgi:hypothetical protein